MTNRTPRIIGHFAIALAVSAMACGGNGSTGGSSAGGGGGSGSSGVGGSGVGGSGVGGSGVGGSGVGGSGVGGSGVGGSGVGGSAGVGASGGNSGSGTGSAGGAGGSIAADAGPVNPYASGGELHLNTYETGEQKAPRIAAADDGSFVAVWMSEGQAAAGSAELWGQRFGATGAKVGPEFQISSTKASNTYYSASLYDVAMAGDGRFVVVWAGYGSTDKNLYAQRYDATGAKAGAVLVVDNTTDEWTEYQASVAMRDDGSFAVLFDWGLNFTVGLKARSYTAAGVATAPAFWVTNIRRAHDIDLAVARGGAAAGTYVAVYRYYDIDTEVFGRRLDATAPLAPEFHVNTTTQGAQSYPSVDVRDDGSFVVVWQSNQTGQGPSYGVYGRRYDSTGAPVGTEFALSSAATGIMSTPGVAVAPDGTFLTVWSGDGGPVGGDWSEVWGRYFNAAGAPVGDAFRVNTFDAFKQQDGRVAGAAAGSTVVAWTDFKQEMTAAGGDATRKLGVYGQRLTPP